MCSVLPIMENARPLYPLFLKRCLLLKRTTIAALKTNEGLKTVRGLAKILHVCELKSKTTPRNGSCSADHLSLTVSLLRTIWRAPARLSAVMHATKGKEWDAVIIVQKGKGNQPDKVRCLHCKYEFIELRPGYPLSSIYSIKRGTYFPRKKWRNLYISTVYTLP